MSSIIWSESGSLEFTFCPLLIIVIGLPILPMLLQGLGWLVFVLSIVDPNLIDCPKRPSNTMSPSYGLKGLVVVLSLKYSPSWKSLFSVK